MDGMQLFAEIQKVQPGMPVIILTAHGSIPDAVAATQQGVFSFLTKPVDKDALYQAIDDALDNPRQPPMNAGARQLSPAAR
ncbi:response regulator [Shigella flexneri]